MAIIKKHNIERVVSDSDLQRFIKDGYVQLDKKDTSNETPDGETGKKKTLEEMTVPEIKEIAKELGIEGYSSLNRPELIKVISDHDGTEQQ